MKSQIFPLILLVVIAGAITAGVWWFHRGNGAAPDNLVLHGNVDVRQVELAFNASERLVDVLVHEGEHVKKGQVLAHLATDRMALAVQQAEAQVAAQQQVVARLVAGARLEEIGKARAEADAAAVDASNALDGQSAPATRTLAPVRSYSGEAPDFTTPQSAEHRPRLAATEDQSTRLINRSHVSRDFSFP